LLEGDAGRSLGTYAASCPWPGHMVEDHNTTALVRPPSAGPCRFPACLSLCNRDVVRAGQDGFGWLWSSDKSRHVQPGPGPPVSMWHMQQEQQDVRYGYDRTLMQAVSGAGYDLDIPGDFKIPGGFPCTPRSGRNACAQRIWSCAIWHPPCGCPQVTHHLPAVATGTVQSARCGIKLLDLEQMDSHSQG
jgi:hypothetical protein